ncbi:hypothetical protein [Hyphomicrobium sp.]|uniref:hypothetical protein n=1 Tax=Hyphomicrobium sp. TaxID=82 RepID=UPI0025BCFAA4|nr:hypothetical protein [Hyphomicrobium sp.]MCC7252635.1 hypothetical protein [Hyphomicrobium sp.]
MREQLGVTAAWHVTTATRVLRLTPPWVPFVPAAAVLVILWLSTIPSVAPYLDKERAELISPVILAIGVVVGAWLAAVRPQIYFKWLAVFLLCLFLRELHFQGTNTAFYIALVILIWWASRARERLEPFISNRTIVALLMTALWTYFVSKTFDRHLWDGLMTGTLTRDLFEENLEVMGHVLFVALVIVSAFVDGTFPAHPPRD